MIQCEGEVTNNSPDEGMCWDTSHGHMHLVRFVHAIATPMWTQRLHMAKRHHKARMQSSGVAWIRMFPGTAGYRVYKAPCELTIHLGTCQVRHLSIRSHQGVFTNS